MLHKGFSLFASLLCLAVIATRPSGSEEGDQRKLILQSSLVGQPLPAKLVHHAYPLPAHEIEGAAYAIHGSPRGHETVKTSETSAKLPASNLQVKYLSKVRSKSQTDDPTAAMLEDVRQKIADLIAKNGATNEMIGRNKADGKAGSEEDPLVKMAETWATAAESADTESSKLQQELKDVLGSLHDKHEEFRKVLQGDMSETIKNMPPLLEKVDAMKVKATNKGNNEAKEQEEDPCDEKPQECIKFLSGPRKGERVHICVIDRTDCIEDPQDPKKLILKGKEGEAKVKQNQEEEEAFQKIPDEDNKDKVKAGVMSEAPEGSRCCCGYSYHYKEYVALSVKHEYAVGRSGGWSSQKFPEPACPLIGVDLDAEPKGEAPDYCACTKHPPFDENGDEGENGQPPPSALNAGWKAPKRCGSAILNWQANQAYPETDSFKTHSPGDGDNCASACQAYLGIQETLRVRPMEKECFGRKENW